MKNKNIDWISIILISLFSFNSCVSVYLCIVDPDGTTLFGTLMYPICLIAYIILLIVVKNYTSKRYLIIYDDYFEINGQSIFDSKFIAEKKNFKYLKYEIVSTIEKKFLFTVGELILEFGLIDIDCTRKLMIIYKTQNIPDYFYKDFNNSIEDAIDHYYQNHDITPLEEVNIIYKNKRNAYKIKVVNDKYIVARYRHYVPVEIHRLNDISNYKVGWDYIGDSHDDGIQYFESYESAEEYIKYKK